MLQRVGVDRFPLLLIALLALLFVPRRLPVIAEAAHASRHRPRAGGAKGRWWPGSLPLFFTVLAHTSLYAFFSLYLDSLGYSRTAVGLLWATGIVVEVVWFWFQGGWASRFSMHSWLIVAAVASAVRFATVAVFGSIPLLLVLSQGLHALTFAGQHTPASRSSTAFPGRLRGRGQRFYTVLVRIPGCWCVAGGALIEAYDRIGVLARGCGVIAAFCSWRAGLERRWRPPERVALLTTADRRDAP